MAGLKNFVTAELMNSICRPPWIPRNFIRGQKQDSPSAAPACKPGSVLPDWLECRCTSAQVTICQDQDRTTLFAPLENGQLFTWLIFFLFLSSNKLICHALESWNICFQICFKKIQSKLNIVWIYTVNSDKRLATHNLLTASDQTSVDSSSDWSPFNGIITINTGKYKTRI